MGERRPSGVLGKLFGKDNEHEDSEYVELPSPKSVKQKEQQPPQKARSFRLSFLKSSGAGENGGGEDEAAQYRRFSARNDDDKDRIQDGRANGRHHGDGTDVNNSDLQLVPHTGVGSAQEQQEQQEAELSIPQVIKQKAGKWLERFRSQPTAASARSAYASVHHVKASRYIDQGTLQSLSSAMASIASDQRALVLASQPSSEGLWRERGKLAGLKAQRDGWVQKRDGLLEQLRLAEEKNVILKQQVQQRVIAERSAELQRRHQQQLQQRLQESRQTGVVNDVDEIRDGLTSTVQTTEATPDVVDDPSIQGFDAAAEEEVEEEAEETVYMAAPDGLEPSDRASEDDDEQESEETQPEAEVATELLPDEHDGR